MTYREEIKLFNKFNNCKYILPMIASYNVLNFIDKIQQSIMRMLWHNIFEKIINACIVSDKLGYNYSDMKPDNILINYNFRTNELDSVLCDISSVRRTHSLLKHITPKYLNKCISLNEYFSKKMNVRGVALVLIIMWNGCIGCKMDVK